MDAHDAEVAAWLAPHARAAEEARAARDAVAAELEALTAPTGARALTRTRARTRSRHAARTARRARAGGDDTPLRPLSIRFRHSAAEKLCALTDARACAAPRRLPQRRRWRATR
jgi:hypothetical protein